MISEPQRRSDYIAKRLTLHLIWLLPCLLITVCFFRHNFAGLSRADSMDAAQVARNISEGRGFSTSFIRPASLTYRKYSLPYPDLYQAPIYPFALGVVFSIANADDRVVAAFSMLFLLLSSMLVFLWTKRLLGIHVGGLAALLTLLNLAFLESAITGAGIAFWSFLILLAFFLLLNHPGRLRHSLGLGILLGITLLTEYSTFALLPAFIWILITSIESRKRQHLTLFILGTLFVLTPWAIRNYRLVGDPFFSLKAYEIAMFTYIHPGYSLLRQVSFAESGIGGFLVSQPISIIHKIIVGMRNLYGGVPLIMGLYILPFFIVGILHKFNNSRLLRLRVVLYISLPLLVLTSVFTTGAAELLFPLVPIVTILAVAYFETLLGTLSWGAGKRIFAKGLLIAICALPLLFNLLARPSISVVQISNLRYLARVLPENSLIASDIPWAVAWYSNRPSVWLPNVQVDSEFGPDPTKSAQFQLINGPQANIKAIYLSALLISLPANEKLSAWQQLSIAPEGFQVEAVLPGGEILLIRNDLKQDSMNKAGDTS